MGAAALPIAGLATGLVGGIVNSNAQNHATAAAQSAADQATAGQNELIQKGMLPIYQSMLSDYQQNYQPLESGAAYQYGQSENALNSVPTAQNLSALLHELGSPSELDAASGLPMQALTQNILSYFNNPGNTLSGINGQGGKALDFYNQEAQQGLDPQYINNAVRTQQNQFQTNLNSVRNSLGGSVPNLAGTLGDMNYQNDNAMLGLLSSLGAQNQTFKNEAEGAALQTAGGIDSQMQNMLINALNIGDNAQSTQLGRQQAGVTGAQDTLTNLLNYITSGKSTLPGVASGFGGIADTYGQRAAGAANQLAGLSANKSNPFLNFANQFASTAAQQGWFQPSARSGAGVPDMQNASFGGF